MRRSTSQGQARARWIVIGLLGIAGGLMAQGPEPEGVKSGTGKAPRRVESITWDPVGCKLRWTASRGDIEEGKYAPKDLAAEQYEIDFHRAEMTYRGETHKFSEEEAERVHQGINGLTVYAAESVQWFEQQKGHQQKAAARQAPPWLDSRIAEALIALVLRPGASSNSASARPRPKP